MIFFPSRLNSGYSIYGFYHFNLTDCLDMLTSVFVFCGVFAMVAHGGVVGMSDLSADDEMVDKPDEDVEIVDEPEIKECKDDYGV